MPENVHANELDKDVLWVKETPAAVPHSSVSRSRRWLYLVLTAAAVLVLILVLGVSYAKTSHRLWTAEQRVSTLSVDVQSLNASLHHAQEMAKDVSGLRLTVENHEDQLTSVSEALKQLSLVESLSNSVALLRCSLQHLVNNRTAADGCCPQDWKPLGSSCYFFSRFSLPWNESRAWCERRDAHLVILNTDKDWDFVTGESVPDLYWVGLSDWRTGAWEWVNHTPYTVDHRRWVPGQPDSWTGHGLGHGDEDCAQLSFSGRLNDLHCSTPLRFICQKRRPRPPDSAHVC